MRVDAGGEFESREGGEKSETKMLLTGEPSPTHVIHQSMEQSFVQRLHQHVQQHLNHIDDGAGCEDGRGDEQMWNEISLNRSRQSVRHFSLANDRQWLSQYAALCRRACSRNENKTVREHRNFSHLIETQKIKKYTKHLQAGGERPKTMKGKLRP